MMRPVYRLLLAALALPALLGVALEWRLAWRFHGLAHPLPMAKSAEVLLMALLVVLLFTLSGRDEIAALLRRWRAPGAAASWRTLADLLLAEPQAQLRHRVLICIACSAFALATLLAFAVLLACY
jgi:hypothetical protein